MNDLTNAIDQLSKQPPYFRCILFVHPDIVQLQKAASEVAAAFDCKVISIGSMLSHKALTASRSRRASTIERALRSEVLTPDSQLHLLVDIDYLFEPELSLDPLALLKSCSRNRTIVAAWPGNFDTTVLSYAVPNHAHYRTWPKPDLCDYCIQKL